MATGAKQDNGDLIGLRDRVQRAVEDDINSGVLLPGDKLDERLLAKKYDLSRTPVREALNRLASVGVIETRPRQGSFVRRVPPADLMAMFEVNCELEALSARFAARRMTDVERAALLQQVKEGRDLAAQGDNIRYQSHNTAFHQMISTGTHNFYLQAQVEQVKRRSMFYRRDTLRLTGRLAGSATEHADIARAIVEADEDRAFGLMHAHTDIHRPEYRDFVYMLWQQQDRVD